MPTAPRSRAKRQRRPWRRVSLLLMELGVTSEMVGLVGMVFGILGGLSFMATGFVTEPTGYWIAGLVFCLIRIASISINSFLAPLSHRESLEDIFFTELPERVSDAITLIGFGFAVESSPWLGLTAALAAIFSAYVRSFGQMRGAGKETSSSGPMTRVHRLILICLTSLLMIFGVTTENLENLNSTIPKIALMVIILGCLATILIRWLNIRGYSKN